MAAAGGADRSVHRCGAALALIMALQQPVGCMQRCSSPVACSNHNSTVLPHAPQVVWTRSGTGALHILGETFPFTSGSRYAYLDSNHNSVLVRDWH